MSSKSKKAKIRRKKKSIDLTSCAQIVKKEDDLEVAFINQSQKEMTERLINISARTARPERSDLHYNSLLLESRKKSLDLTIELDRKKKEVDERIAIAQARRKVLKEKEKELFEKLATFDGVTFEDGKVLRYQALHRRWKEQKEFEDKEEEMKELEKEVAVFRKTNRDLVEDVKEHLPAKKYLESVYHTAPTGYFDSNEEPAKAVIKRMTTLKANSQHLHEELLTKTDEVSQIKREMALRAQEHQGKMMSLHSKIAELKKRHEELRNSNITREEKLYKSLADQRKKNQEMYKILSAIDNLSVSCETATAAGDTPSKRPSSEKKKKLVAADVNPVDMKLKTIQEFIEHKTSIVDHVKGQLQDEIDKKIASMLPTLPSGGALPTGTGGITAAVLPQATNSETSTPLTSSTALD